MSELGLLDEAIREGLWEVAFEQNSFYHNCGHKNELDELPRGAYNLARNRRAGLFLTMQDGVWLI